MVDKPIKLVGLGRLAAIFHGQTDSRSPRVVLPGQTDFSTLRSETERAREEALNVAQTRNSMAHDFGAHLPGGDRLFQLVSA